MKIKKFIRWLLLILASLLLIGCSLFDDTPIEPQIIGTGYVQRDTTIHEFKSLYIEINSVRYSPHIIYTGVYYQKKTYPREGMLLTGFFRKNSTTCEFIMGEKTVDEIEKACKPNEILALVLALILIFVCTLISGIDFKHINKLAKK